MFTGLIEDVGTIVRKTRSGVDVTLEVSTNLPLDEFVLGESIAVNGVCLTVTSKPGTSFTADASSETMRLTGLGQLEAGSRIHLERALRVGDRLGGHFVQGHVDGTGRIARSSKSGRAWEVWIDMEERLLREVVPKGSITVDGVSLTVNELSDSGFRLTIVPHTETATLLTEYRPGHRVNIETDVIGKYVRHLLGLGGDGVADVLKRFGYTE
jgi:riboflavin synthase